MKSKITLLFSIVFLSYGAFATSHLIQFGGSIGMAYSPSVVLANIGDTVIWGGDFSFHPLESTSVPSGANTFNVTSGTSFIYILSVAGDYNFRCSVHLFTGQVKASTGSTGTLNKTAQSEILIYPTAVHNFLKISLPSSGKSLIADVKNIVGQTVLQIDLSEGSINTLDFSGLYNGIYFVAIRNDMDVVKVVRVVKE